MIKEQMQNICLLLLDVDGVMTDGGIAYDNNGVETKRFHVRDGHGLKLLQRAGIEVGIITGRESNVVLKRAAELGITRVFQGAKNKLEPYKQILQDTGLTDAQIAYVGDDLIDLPILRRVGFAVAVADAVVELRPWVDYVTSVGGGKGAVREVCDLILKQSGRWEEVTARYFE
ncbi:MAG: HAD-IIIA family hydrolase [Desulfuromonadaceae bacterium]|nr:HAD-IIIA family hydrolase [Desulfuromonadaceae bacterium]